MRCAVLAHPLENLSVVIEPIGDRFERVAIQLQERKQMLVEADSLVVVAVEQPLAVEPRFIDQPRQMDVTAELLVRTAGAQFLSHCPKGYVAGIGTAPPISTASEEA